MEDTNLEKAASVIRNPVAQAGIGGLALVGICAAPIAGLVVATIAAGGTYLVAGAERKGEVHED
jgi:hypothetical protein